MGKRPGIVQAHVGDGRLLGDVDERQFQPRHVVAHFPFLHALVGAMFRWGHAEGAAMDNGR
jgi:hypothetical protein